MDTPYHQKALGINFTLHQLLTTSRPQAHCDWLSSLHCTDPLIISNTVGAVMKAWPGQARKAHVSSAHCENSLGGHSNHPTNAPLQPRRLGAAVVQRRGSRRADGRSLLFPHWAPVVERYGRCLLWPYRLETTDIRSHLGAAEGFLLTGKILGNWCSV
jgi:hypothetical protein